MHSKKVHDVISTGKGRKERRVEEVRTRRHEETWKRVEEGSERKGKEIIRHFYWDREARYGREMCVEA